MKMKLRFEKFSRNNILLSILMVVLGVVLFVWPGKTLEVAAKLIGVALLAGAVVSFISWWRERKDPDAGYASLAIAIVCVIVGLVVLLAPMGFVSMLPKIIGAAVLLNGILNLAQAIEMRSRGERWLSSLAMAIGTILLGLFLILFAFSAMKAAVMVIGGISIFNGLSNLFIERRYRRSQR